MTQAHDQAHSRTSMGELLGAFAFASDLAFGLELEDSLRCTYAGVRLAEELPLPDSERFNVYYASLLKDAGCTSWTSDLYRVFHTNDEIAARRQYWFGTDWASESSLRAWLNEHIATELAGNERESVFVQVLADMPAIIFEAICTVSEVSGRIARRLSMPPCVQQAMMHLFEQWNGGGAPSGLAGESIPVGSRVVLPLFLFIPMARDFGLRGAFERIRPYAGSMLDPGVIEALGRLIERPDFEEGLTGPGIRERVLAMEPLSSLSDVSDDGIDDIALAFADFIDLKSRFAASHSRRVARIAEQIALLMGCAPNAAMQIRRAAMLHDLGLVGVPSFSLEKDERELTMSEVERYRLHPYMGERILAQVPATAAYAEMVGSHQERLDGSGYYRGLRDRGISLGARIIAVSDRIDELLHEAPGRPALPLEDAIARIENDRGFDPAVVAVLRRALGEATPAAPKQWPAGLTTREVEVLRLAAKGITRAQVGSELGISESTVRHHLEHIYEKTGTSSRVGATLFAIENGLIE